MIGFIVDHFTDVGTKSFCDLEQVGQIIPVVRLISCQEAFGYQSFVSIALKLIGAY